MVRILQSRGIGEASEEKLMFQILEVIIHI